MLQRPLVVAMQGVDVHVIFLDVDGVLNSEAFLRKREDEHRALGHADPTSPKRETTCDCFRLERQIDRDAVARLNRLVAETGAKIVISSSWRKLLDPPELHRVLVSHGLVAEIIGETPDGPNDLELRAALEETDRLFRGHEIDYWLKQHPEVDRFVILDDGGDMVMHVNRLVQTDCQEGLLDEHVDLAIRVMSWDGKTVPTPMDELESCKNTWPCPGKPEELRGQPIGMYHCEFCGEMQLAGVPHLPPQSPAQWEEPFPKVDLMEDPESAG